MRQKLPRLTIEGMDAFNAAWAAICDAVETAGNIEGSGSLAVFQGPTGLSVVDQVKEPIWIKLTSAASGTGQYHFTQVYPSSGGGWTAYPSPLTGTCWEFNTTAGILGVINPYYTKAKWYNTAAGGEWRFQAGLCNYIPPLPSFDWFQPFQLPGGMHSSASTSGLSLAVTSSSSGLFSTIPIPPGLL